MTRYDRSIPTADHSGYNAGLSRVVIAVTVIMSLLVACVVVALAIVLNRRRLRRWRARRTAPLAHAMSTMATPAPKDAIYAERSYLRAHAAEMSQQKQPVAPSSIITPSEGDHPALTLRDMSGAETGREEFPFGEYKQHAEQQQQPHDDA